MLVEMLIMYASETTTRENKQIASEASKFEGTVEVQETYTILHTRIFRLHRKYPYTQVFHPLRLSD